MLISNIVMVKAKSKKADLSINKMMLLLLALITLVILVILISGLNKSGADMIQHHIIDLIPGVTPPPPPTP